MSPRGDDAALVAGMQQFAATPAGPRSSRVRYLPHRADHPPARAGQPMPSKRTRGIVRQPIFEISGPGGSQRLVGLPVRRGALGGD